MKCLDLLLKKWIEVHDQSGSAEDRFKPRKQIRFKTSMLRSDFCDFSDACIVGKREILLLLLQRMQIEVLLT